MSLLILDSEKFNCNFYDYALETKLKAQAAEKFILFVLLNIQVFLLTPFKNLNYANNRHNEQSCIENLFIYFLNACYII